MIGKELTKKRFLSGIEVVENALMSSFCTMRVGGRARMVCLPRNLHQLKRVLKFAKLTKKEVVIIGAGSNILFKNGLFAGVVISLKNFKTVCKIRRTKIVCSAQVHLAHIVKTACNNGLSGLEFAVGVPAQVGGATVMNAGAFGTSMADVISRVRVLDNGKTKWLSGAECEFCYRSSGLKCKKMIVLAVEFKLTRKPTTEIIEAMKIFGQKRASSQPSGFSCGSVFKNPEGFYAGFLIEQAGLKGTKIGGAEVSLKHANFIVNTGNATAQNVEDLIKFAQRVVFEKFHIELQPEIEIIGENENDTRRLPHP